MTTLTGKYGTLMQSNQGDMLAMISLFTNCTINYQHSIGEAIFNDNNFL
jgi:hypothetical protein